MYNLIITKIRYPKNDTKIYNYTGLENLLIGLKALIENKKIKKNDIIRIEKE